MVTLTLLAFIGLVWLREQILHGGGPEWLDINAGDINDQQQHQHVQPPQHLQPQPVDDDDPPGGLPDNLPVEPAAPEILDNANMGAANNQNNELNLGDDGQWNPMEWDRAAEELTWERLLGLDGSLVFLEHVFWVSLLSNVKSLKKLI